MKKVLVVALAVASMAVASPAEAGPHMPRPCKYEDSNNCFWDARHMGNGRGKSFIVNRAGEVTYISHRRAHRMLVIAHNC